MLLIGDLNYVRNHIFRLDFTKTTYCYKVKDNIYQNTTGLLAGCSYDDNETTCFGLLGSHHQVYKCYL